MHSMDWDGLQVFLAVARVGRISAAARRLQVEHTTVSRRLAALEADLGVPLFYRTTKGYLLTPHGQNMLANVEAMDREAVALAARAREGSGAIAGLVRLALAPEFASHWLAPHLAAFKKKHPEIRLQILVGTRQRDLSRGEAELAVQSPRPRQQGVVAVRLGTATAALYASKSFLAGKRLRIDEPAAADGLPLLVYTSAFQLLQEARWFQPILESGDIVLETNSTHALVAAARADAGVAVLPRFVARWHEDLIEVSEPVTAQDVWLITHPEFRRDPKIRATADFLRRIASATDGIC